jgi:hypothetical protein
VFRTAATFRKLMMPLAWICLMIGATFSAKR